MLWLVLVGVASGATAAEADFSVIANGQVGVTQMNRAEFRRVFLGAHPMWETGQRVTLVLPAPGSPAMRWLCSRLRVSERLYRRGLMERALRGEINKPIQLKPGQDGVQTVSEIHGAVTPAVVSGDTELTVIEVTP